VKHEHSQLRCGAGSYWVALTLFAALTGVLCCSAPAFALSARGHAFARSFSVDSSDGGLREPAGVAVSEASGDVYVVDRGNNRIDRFSASGQFIEAWGWGVADGKREYEKCSSGCRAGLAGNGKFELNGADAVAVDNSGSPGDPSNGDVYVEANTSEEHATIEKFSPEGTGLLALKDAGGEEFEGLHGLTVDPSGALWVYDEEYLYVLSDAEHNKLCPEAGKKPVPSCPGFSILEPELEGVHPRYGVALDGHGALYLGRDGFGGSGQLPDVISKQKLTHGKAGEAPTLEPVIEELDHEDTTAVVVDPASGDVYLDNGTSVAAFDSGGVLIQRFGEGEKEGGLKGGAGIAVVSSASGSDASRAGYLYVADAGSDRIDVFEPEEPGKPRVDSLSVQDVTAQSARLNAQIDPSGSSTHYYFRYGSVSCAKSAASCTDLPVPPGEEIGPGCPRAEESSCFFDQGVAVQALNLKPRTTYHYGVVATNASGEVETDEGHEGTFTTPPVEGEFIADGRGWEMVSPADMNGGEAEPLAQGGSLIQASAGGTGITYVATAPLTGAEGSRSLEATQLISTRGSDGWSTQDIVTPNGQGTGLELGKQEYRFFSPSLALSLVQPFIAFKEGKLAEPPLSPPLSQEERGRQEKTVYLRADAPLAPEATEEAAYHAAKRNGEAMGNPGFLALVTAANVTPKVEFGEALRFRDATPDFSHVVIASEVALTAGSAAGSNRSNLYEWSAGKLQLINVLPGEEDTPAEAPALGDGNTLVRHAISNDGSRVFWGTNRQGHLYMRDMSRGETIQIDGSGSETGSAIFQTASADGSRVFFTDESRLTAGSGAAMYKPDLYVCEVVEVAGRLSCKLTDLTGSRSGESADVLVLGLGASEDGSSVYFVANGVLSDSAAAAGAKPGQCRPNAFQAAAGCNLYLEHYDSAAGHEGWEEPRFIARLSGEDAPDWTPTGKQSIPTEPELGEVTSRVSPNGRYLAFMSDQSLTGYDNRDANPAANGARDEEVFLYDSSTGRLICASCDPSGARPRGVFDPPEAEPANEEGWGLVVDRPKIWQGRWLAGSVPGWTKIDLNVALYQSRYLSNSGRLYFDSPADLVPEATNGKEDVYEYQPAGVPQGTHECASSSATFTPSSGGCLGLISSGTSPRESTFLDAGQSGGEGAHGEELEEGGGEVFFLTAGLSAQDTGASFAVYDAHECTGERPCLDTTAPVTPVPCASSESCRPVPYSPPASVTPASANASGSGNLAPQGNVLAAKVTVKPKPLTRAQKLAKALKACRKLKSRKKRAACEAQARKKYGPAKKACRKLKSRKKRAACEAQARKKYGPAKKARKSGVHPAKPKRG